MNLSEYIAKLGNKRAADLFGVEEGTTKAWRYGYRRPSIDAAQRIVAATGGEITLASIYNQPPKKAA